MPASREQLQRDRAADPEPQATADDQAEDQAEDQVERAVEDAEAEAEANRR